MKQMKGCLKTGCFLTVILFMTILGAAAGLLFVLFDNGTAQQWILARSARPSIDHGGQETREVAQAKKKEKNKFRDENNKYKQEKKNGEKNGPPIGKKKQQEKRADKNVPPNNNSKQEKKNAEKKIPPNHKNSLPPAKPARFKVTVKQLAHLKPKPVNGYHPFTSFVFSADSKAIWFVHRTTSRYPPDVQLRKWDTTKRKELASKKLPDTGAISPNGKYLACPNPGSPNGAFLWDVSKGVKIGKLPGYVDVTFSQNSSRLLLVDQIRRDDKPFTEVSVWDVPTLQKKIARQVDISPGFMQSTGLSPDAKTMALCGLGKDFELWDVGNGKKRVALSNDFSVAKCNNQFTADGKTMFAGYKTGIRLVEMQAAKVIGYIPPKEGDNAQRLASLGVSGDGRIAAGLRSGGSILENQNTILIFDIENREEVHRFNVPVKRLTSLTLSPDGRYLAALERTGKSMFIWEVILKPY